MAYVKDIKTPVSPSASLAAGDPAHPTGAGGGGVSGLACWGLERPRGVCSCCVGAGRRRGRMVACVVAVRVHAWIVHRAHPVRRINAPARRSCGDAARAHPPAKIRPRGCGGGYSARGTPPVPLAPDLHVLRIFRRPNPYGDPVGGAWWRRSEGRLWCSGGTDVLSAAAR